MQRPNNRILKHQTTFQNYLSMDNTWTVIHTLHSNLYTRNNKAIAIPMWKKQCGNKTCNLIKHIEG